MATLLCASCGHSFPDSMLKRASFSDRLGRCLSQTTQLVRDTRGKTSADDHRLVQLGQLLQQLCGMMEEEVQLLHERLKDPRGGAAGTGKKTGVEVLTLSQGTTSEAVTAAAAAAPAPAATMNGAFGSTIVRQTPQVLNGTATALERAGASPKMFGGTVPSYQLRRMMTAFELVSATLYSVLESLAVQCRAGVALLWLRPRQNASSDLVAPFVVGRELSSLAHSAPYSTPEASIPCIVCQTGVALNMAPQPHPPAAITKELAVDLSLTELMEQTNAAQLLVPVYDRYTERNAVTATTANTNSSNNTTATTTAAASCACVIAVVHLIGSPLHPVPFHRHNEETAAQTAALLSYILSSYYDAMIAEWVNRFYVPATLKATAKYTAELDMRPEDKVMDDFTPPPLLIYRMTVSDSRVLQSANEARDGLKLLQQNALRRSTPLRPMANVKDLRQHATNMEANWVSAVQQNARLEKEIGTLEEDLLRRDVGALQREQKGRGGAAAARRSLPSSASSTTQLSVTGGLRQGGQAVAKGKTAPAPIHNTPAAVDVLKSTTSLDIPVKLAPAVSCSTEGGAAVHAAAGNPPPALSSDVLNPEEMELLEAVTLRRLKALGADTTIFETSP